MKPKILVAVFFFILINIGHVFGQIDFSALNDLPVTLEVKAFDFNTVKKYSVVVDTVRNKLYILDKRMSSTGKLHLYQ